MQLSKQESSAAFWVGAKKGALRSLAYIAAIAVPVAALVMAGALAPVSITVGIISALSTALTVGMFSGHNAVAQYHQQKHNRMYEAKIAQLEGRAIQYEETPENHLQHSPRLTTILEEGTRNASSTFAEKEETRASEDKPRTLH